MNSLRSTILSLASLFFVFLVGCALNQSTQTQSVSSSVDTSPSVGRESGDDSFLHEVPSSSEEVNSNEVLKLVGDIEHHDILPVEHVCNDHVTLHVSSVTDSQVEEVCAGIQNAEDKFHRILGTNYQPVKGDVNDFIHIYIFDGYKHYIDNVAKVSGLVNNPKGGYFYEGNPFNHSKNPAVYLFVSASETFSVWNLKHEFTHYLNARFVKYGHVKDSALYLFWEEGLAEYMAKENDNDAALALAKGAKSKTLSDIFDVTYSDGSDDVYLWSYLGIRYLIERQAQSVYQIIHALRTDDDAAFKLALKTVAESQESDFQLWLKSL